MKILVLGAAGGTGMEIVRQAIEHGHQVTAFVRSPESLKAFANRVTIIQGNLLDRAELAKAMRGNEAVLSGFGPRVPISKNDRTLLQRFAAVLRNAMQESGLRRLLIVSVAFLFKDAILPPAYLFGRLFFRHIVEDSAEMENVIERSGLDWTIVRPPRLTNAARAGKYRVREGHLPRFGFAVSRADVADFMIKAAEDHSFGGKIVGVCN